MVVGGSLSGADGSCCAKSGRTQSSTDIRTTAIAARPNGSMRVGLEHRICNQAILEIECVTCVKNGCQKRDSGFKRARRLSPLSITLMPRRLTCAEKSAENGHWEAL